MKHMKKRTGAMYAACGLIVLAGALALIFLMIVARETREIDTRAAKHFLGVYLYCAGLAVPCALAVGMLAAIIREIGLGRAFSKKTAAWMKGISWMAALECAYILAGLIGWSIIGFMHPSVLMISLAVVMLGAGIGLLAWALSGFIRRLCARREEADLPDIAETE